MDDGRSRNKETETTLPLAAHRTLKVFLLKIDGDNSDDDNGTS
jgi:hypothetical protein